MKKEKQEMPSNIKLSPLNTQMEGFNEDWWFDLQDIPVPQTLLPSQTAHAREVGPETW